MPFLRKDHDKLFYFYEPAQKTANAEPIILLHGNGMNHTSYDLMVPLLNEHYDILRYDLRGFGQSDLGNRTLTWEIYMEDLMFLIHSLHIKQFHIVGHGFGANIALKFAVMNQDLLKSMVLLSIPAYFPQQYAEKAAEQRRMLTANGSLLPFVNDLLKLITVLPLEHPEIQKIWNGYAQVTLSTYFQIIDLVVHSRSIHDLNSIHIPTLMISGENDVVFPPYLTGIAAYYLPVYKFLTVPGASNLLFIDQTELTANWILRHIESPGQNQIHDDLPASFYENLRQYVQRIIVEGEKKVNALNELKVEILHSFRVYINGEEILEGWNQRSSKQILLYLIFHRSVTREQLCDILWPDLPLSKSRSRLRVYLSHLNGLLNNKNNKYPFLITDNEQIHLQGLISCDGMDYMDLLNETLHEKNPRKKLLSGEKLFNEIPTNLFNAIYDDWFLELRERVENNLITLAEWLTTQYMQSGEINEAVHCLKTALHLRPEDEKLSELLMTVTNKSQLFQRTRTIRSLS